MKYRSTMTGRNTKITAISAKRIVRRIVLVAFDGVQILDFAGPSSIFARANEYAPGSYRIIHASPDGRSVKANCGIILSDLKSIKSQSKNIDTIIVAGSDEVGLRTVIAEGSLVSWLLRMAPRTRRLGSVCTGAFVLAAAGLLDNRKAVTHWASCDLLKELRPMVKVQPNAIFIKDGTIFTSAGVTASIDAALALVEEDLGRAIAADIAKSMVLFLRRPGGQSQYSKVLAAQSRSCNDFVDLIAWISNNLNKDLSVPSLAERTGMSERSFIRKFRTETGSTPAAFVRTIRLESACTWLESTHWPVKRVAKLAGFGSTDSLERAMRTHLDTTPAIFRNAYGSSR